MEDSNNWYGSTSHAIDLRDLLSRRLLNLVKLVGLELIFKKFQTSHNKLIKNRVIGFDENAISIINLGAVRPAPSGLYRCLYPYRSGTRTDKKNSQNQNDIAMSQILPNC